MAYKLTSDTLKRNWGWVACAIVAITLDLRHGDFFLVMLYLYALFIRLLVSKFIREDVKRVVAIFLWSLFALQIILTVYVNYCLPHGPSYSTGDVVCINDGRGPCGMEYKEDMRELDIPGWAKFLRQSGGKLLLFGLIGAGIAASIKKDEDEED